MGTLNIKNLPVNTKSYSWKFWLWFTAAMLIVMIIAVVGATWSVRHVIINGGSRFSETQARIVMAVAEFPGLVIQSVSEVKSILQVDPLPLLSDRKAIETQYWVRKFPSREDTGYLLFSGVDPVAKQSVVQLIRISDGMKLAEWKPDWPNIFSQQTAKKYGPIGSPKAAQAVHPVLLENGDIIFNTSVSLVRLSPCTYTPVWVLDEVIHHAIELDDSGTAIWVPSVAYDGFSDNPWFRDRVRDDSLAHVSIDGKILERRSFIRILRNNGLLAMVAGVLDSGDPIHMNQIRVAPKSSKYWQRGDLLISAARINSIFLYRPSTDKVIWHQTGPWMGQHSVDFVDDHRISIFNNNVIPSVTLQQSFIAKSDRNQVLLYDFDTKQVSQPFESLMAEARPLTITGGRARVLPDGGLFIEETNYGRHLRFTRDRLLWSRINDYDDKRIGAVSLSRYLTAEEASIPLRALESRGCVNKVPKN